MKDDIIRKNIIELLGLEKLPEKKKEEMLARMSAIVQSRISRRVDQTLTDTQKEQFGKLIEKNANEQEVNAFLVTHVQNFDELATDEIMKFKEEMVKEATMLREQLAA